MTPRVVEVHFNTAESRAVPQRRGAAPWGGPSSLHGAFPPYPKMAWISHTAQAIMYIDSTPMR